MQYPLIEQLEKEHPPIQTDKKENEQGYPENFFPGYLIEE